MSNIVTVVLSPKQRQKHSSKVQQPRQGMHQSYSFTTRRIPHAVVFDTLRTGSLGFLCTPGSAFQTERNPWAIRVRVQMSAAAHGKRRALLQYSSARSLSTRLWFASLHTRAQQGASTLLAGVESLAIGKSIYAPRAA